jgi:hypothetical protein
VVFATHSPADLNDLVIQLTNTKIAMRSEPKVLERVDMAEYAGELAYAQSGVAVAKSFVYRTHAVTFCRPRRGTEESSDPRRSAAPSPGVCQRAPALYSWTAPDPPLRRLWMRRLSARGGAQAFSSMRERAGRSASLPPAGEARRDSARTVALRRRRGRGFCRRPSCRRLPSSLRLLRQPAETARPAGATCRRSCVLKRLQTKAAGRLELSVHSPPPA